MSKKLKDLKKMSMRVYFNYKSGLLTREKYLEEIKLLDDKIDREELHKITYYLQDNLAFEISSSEHQD